MIIHILVDTSQIPTADEYTNGIKVNNTLWSTTNIFTFTFKSTSCTLQISKHLKLYLIIEYL